MIKITPYGFIAGLATTTGLSMLQEKSLVILFALIITILLQTLICKNCKGKFALSAFIGIFPLILLLLILDCEILKKSIAILSFMFAVGRIGCYFAGCCTGKICSNINPLRIEYKNGSIVVDKYYKKNVCVYPTIFLEIFLQFCIFYLVWKSEYGLPLFGITNAILLYVTSLWRDNPRPNSWGSIFSLILFSVLSYLKCGKINSKIDLKLKPDLNSLISGIVMALVLSNDINFK